MSFPPSIVIDPSHLAPGDQRSAALDFSGISFHRISGSGHPLFYNAYRILWDEFGSKHEMESLPVIEKRLSRPPVPRPDGSVLLYEMIVVGSGETIIAVRDHTAIIPTERDIAVVHLSHLLVDPAWRRSGIAGWMRCWPLQTAQRALEIAGLPEETPINFVAEMEHPDSTMADRVIRLKAYEKAGFKKADPALVPYHQPDFRSPEEIDGTGGPQPIPMGLVMRRLGRESETTISGSEIITVVNALYSMFRPEFRPSDMAAVDILLERYPAPGASISLLPPSA